MFQDDHKSKLNYNDIDDDDLPGLVETYHEADPTGSKISTAKCPMSTSSIQQPYDDGVFRKGKPKKYNPNSKCK